MRPVERRFRRISQDTVSSVSPAYKLCQNDISRSRTIVLPRNVVFGAVRMLCCQTRYDVPTRCPCHSRKLGACSPVLRQPIHFYPRVGAILLSSSRSPHLWTYGLPRCGPGFCGLLEFNCKVLTSRCFRPRLPAAILSLRRRAPHHSGRLSASCFGVFLALCPD